MFTEFVEFGTVYLLYVEIGKTLQDMALDDDDHIGDEAYKPFRHYASDFIIRYWGMPVESINKYHKLYKQHYDENKEFIGIGQSNNLSEVLPKRLFIN